MSRVDVPNDLGMSVRVVRLKKDVVNGETGVLFPAGSLTRMPTVRAWELWREGKIELLSIRDLLIESKRLNRDDAAYYMQYPFRDGIEVRITRVDRIREALGKCPV